MVKLNLLNKNSYSFFGGFWTSIKNISIISVLYISNKL